LWALQEGLGHFFTAEIRSAWTKVYGVLAEAMQAGAARVEPIRAAS